MLVFDGRYKKLLIL